MNDLKRHVLIKQLFCFCLFLSGLGLWGYANATTHCDVRISFQPDADELWKCLWCGYDKNSNLEVTTSEQNTLTRFHSLDDRRLFTMATAYRGGDSCFASMIADGYSK
jgi:CHASE1-domain containing sensor protein